MPLDRRNRKGEKDPLLIRGHDNDYTALLKLIRREKRRNASNLPQQELDPGKWRIGESVMSGPPKIGIGIGTTGIINRGNDVLLHFNDVPTGFTPVDAPGGRRTEPTPQGMMRSIGGMWLTPVYNYGAGQTRFDDPVATSVALSDIHFSYADPGDTPDSRNDAQFQIIGAVAAGQKYTISIANPAFWTVSVNDVVVATPGAATTWVIFEAGNMKAIISGDYSKYKIGDSWTVWTLDVPTQMAGETTVFKVQSKNDYVAVRECSILVSMPAGRSTLWVQGYDDGDDGDRRYYLIDAHTKMVLYYEYDSVGGVSKLVYQPNTDHPFKLEIDIEATGPHGWFGYLPNKITFIWDYSAQIFELFFNDQRAWGEPDSIVPLPDIMKENVSLGNSLMPPLPNIVSPRVEQGEEPCYCYVSEWIFSRLGPGLGSVSAVDGFVSQSLIPWHDGWFTNICCCLTPPFGVCFTPVYDPLSGYLLTPAQGYCEPMTPITLGSESRPFDEVWTRRLYVDCYMNAPGYTDLPTGKMVVPAFGGSQSLSYIAEPGTKINFTVTVWDSEGNMCNLVTDAVVIPADGEYQINFKAEIHNVTAGGGVAFPYPAWRLNLQLNGPTWPSLDFPTGIECTDDDYGSIVYINGAGQYALSAGDLITLYVFMPAAYTGGTVSFAEMDVHQL